MLAREFMQQLESGIVPKVVLLCPGKAAFNKEPFEPLLAERAIDLVVSKFVDPSLSDLVHTVFYADETAPGTVACESQTMPFLADRRVVIVRRAEKYMGMASGTKSPLNPLLEYLKSPSESTVLVLVSSQVDQRKVFFKACKESGLLVECPQLTDRELTQWVATEIATLGKRLVRGASEELLRRAGGQLSDVNNAVTLVAAYVGDATTVTEEDVIAACADVAEETVWALTDAIAASDTPKAVATLHRLIALGKSPDEIIGIIHWLLETAYRVAPQSRLAVKSQFVADKVKPLVQRLGFEKIKTACILCTDTQFMMRCTGVDRTMAIELLVIKLAYRPRGRSAA
jgi:DNA polymerase-3 subunit delta